MRTLPWDGVSRYDAEILKKALKEIAAGRDVAANTTIARTQLYYLYIDGICGHSCRVGTVRFNEKTKLHEIGFIGSRGVFGKVSDAIEPSLRILEFAAKTGLMVTAVQQEYNLMRYLVRVDGPTLASIFGAKGSSRSTLSPSEIQELRKVLTDGKTITKIA
jgi:hypothetical protein